MESQPALIGASRVQQVEDNVAALANLKFATEELQEIDRILDGLVDPAGQFYRFNLAGSLLRASKAAQKG